MNRSLIRYIVIGIFVCSCLAIINSCIDPYNPATTKADPKYLVVDGFLNSTDKSCTIKLTHTAPLNEDSSYIPSAERGATVQIEEENGPSFPLVEITSGEYSATNLNIDASKNYRLKITTKNQKQYRSDFVPVVQTPAIDSITWGVERRGIYVNVNTHDIENKTHYYMWDLEETWKYFAGYDSEYSYIGDSVFQRPFSFYTCYSSEKSSDLLLSSTLRLAQDVVTQFPLTIISWESPKISIRYSVLVKQRSLTKGGYDYWEQVKKNTENLGTLFGPLPSRVVGNIQCVTDTEEPVMGYFSAGSVQQQRIFISPGHFRPAGAPRPVTGYENCDVDSIIFSNGGVLHGELISPIMKGPAPVGWTSSALSCVDCRFKGGSLTKPDFWQ